MNDFKAGDETEAYQIANILRSLLHDTGKSTSVLSYIDWKEKMFYYSSAAPYSFINLMPYNGLVYQKITVGKGVEYVSGMDDKERQIICLSFDDWWNQIVIDDKNEKFTRKDLVLYIANKEGGCHVDAEVDENYDELFNYNSIGWEYIESHMESGVNPLNNIVFMSIYATAQELYKTIEFYKNFVGKAYSEHENRFTEVKAFMHKRQDGKRVFSPGKEFNEYLYRGANESGFKMTVRTFIRQSIQLHDMELGRTIIR